jgi:hypothetical protein
MRACPQPSVTFNYESTGVTLAGPGRLLEHARFLYRDFVGAERVRTPRYDVEWDDQGRLFRIWSGSAVELEGEGEAEAIEALDWYVASHLLGDLSSGLVVLHAACLEPPGGGVVLLLAPSGGGKSTLAAALLERGCRLLSDEFVPIDARTLRPWAYPRALGLKGGRPVSECAFEAEVRLDRSPERARWLRPRCRLPPGPQPEGIRAILRIAMAPAVGPELAPLSSSRILALMIGQAPMLGAAPSAGFACLAALADRAPGHWLTFGDAAEAAGLILAETGCAGGAL